MVMDGAAQCSVNGSFNESQIQTKSSSFTLVYFQCSHLGLLTWTWWGCSDFRNYDFQVT